MQPLTRDNILHVHVHGLDMALDTTKVHKTIIVMHNPTALHAAARGSSQYHPRILCFLDFPKTYSDN